ncbi:MAG TPA: hypothetical protein VGS23_07280 [Thermoplasmata archaeon]|nr:hypothetical protein [Thermoplasmata archaeon]
MYGQAVLRVVGPATRAKGWVRRIGLSWLALELGAGILALILLVALLPLVAIALPGYLGLALPGWALAVDVLSVSVPLAVLLGVSALRLPLEVVRG